MSETKFTPAPWLQSATDMGLWIQPIDGNEPVICDLVLRGDEPNEEDFANLALIAAAPRMYAALAKFEDRFRKQTESYLSECKITDEEAEEVLSILAAARGEANPEQP